MHPSQPTSAAIRTARTGDRRAVAQLFDAHWERAWQIAYAVSRDRDLAEDAAQEGLVRALRSLGSFDEARPFEPWLHRIVVNCTRDLLRAEARRRRSEPLASDTKESDELGADVDEVWLGMGTLSVGHRSVLVLRYWFGYEPSEIAEILGVPPGTIYSRLHRALSHLRDYLEVHDVKVD